MSELTNTSTGPTDILRLFREDLDPSERVEAFKTASEQLNEQLEQIATPENVDRINETFDIKLVLNSHGDAINVGQSLAVVGNPLITFVENAGDTEIVKNGLFEYSANNAFDVRFNGMPPRKPIYTPPNPSDWGYWRDRGLLNKGSIIAPVDIRHYSRRLLDALMGSDYDQQFLNGSVPGYELKSKSIEELIDAEQQKGLLVLYSNAVRELTSTKQVLETLNHFQATEHGEPVYGAEISDRLRALMQKTRIENGKVPVGIIYGTGHHTMWHLYKKFGVEVSRTFAGAADEPGRALYLGSVKNQFFASHVFGISDERARKYATQLVLEGMLWEPIDNMHEHGYAMADHQVAGSVWRKVMKLARDKQLVENIADLHQDFKTNPLCMVPILEAAGIRLTKIG